VSDKSARILVRVRLVDDPHAEVGEDVRVSVGVCVGAVEHDQHCAKCTEVVLIYASHTTTIMVRCD